MGDLNVTQDGQTYSIPEEQLQSAIAQGFRPESGDEAAGRTSSVAQGERYGGVTGGLEAGLLGAARTATFGGSDALFSALGAGDEVKGVRDVNPGLTKVGEFAGMFAPIGPAHWALGTGERIAKFGEGGGIVGRAVADTAGGAFAGATQNAGNYLSQVALEDKPLSAEGFVGAMHEGAMWGGGAAGALSLASSALMRAKALFPQSEITSAAAAKVDQQAKQEIASALDDGETMSAAAQRKLRELRVAKAQIDLEEKAQISAANVQSAQSKLEREQLKTRRVFDAADQARTKPAMQWLDRYRVFDEPAVATAPAVESDLMSRLQGTKQALDSGADLGALSGGRAAHVIEANDAAISAVSPDAAKLVDATSAYQQARAEFDAWSAKYGGKESKVAQFERQQASRDYASGIRPKESGYYSSTAEGTTAVPRGRQAYFRGTDAERAAADARITAKVTAEDQLAGDVAAQRMFGKRTPESIAQEITAPRIEPVSAEDAIVNALGKRTGEHVDLAPDINEAAKVIGNLEKTHADLTDAIGADAPVSAVERTKQYRAAVASKVDSAATGQAAIAEKLQPAVAKGSAADLGSAVGSAAGKAADAVGVLELLGHLGHHVSGLPVVGPILSLFLKAKAIMGVIGRKGGSVGHTAETVIAGKAAITRNRINAAMQQLLNTSAKVATRAIVPAAATTAILGHALFPGGAQRKGKPDPIADYHARMDDIAKAQQPGALAAAIGERIRTSDPSILAAIVDAKQRGIAFLDRVAPKATVEPTLMNQRPFQPTKQQLNQFSRYVKAVDDPASVFEGAMRGDVSIEGIEALKAVYPALYADAQRTLIQNSQKLDKALPYSRCVSLSILFGVPVDGTCSASHIQFLAAPKPGAVPSQTPNASPPTPGIAGPVNVGSRMMTGLDRRAGA